MSASEEESYLNNLAYTLSGKRSSLPWKSFIMGASVKDLQENLLTNLSKPVRSSTGPNLAFVFTGQGAQWHAMGRELSAYPVYESSLQRFDSVLKSLRCEWSLIGKFYLMTRMNLLIAAISPYSHAMKLRDCAIINSLDSLISC